MDEIFCNPDGSNLSVEIQIHILGNILLFKERPGYQVCKHPCILKSIKEKPSSSSLEFMLQNLFDNCRQGENTHSTICIISQFDALQNKGNLPQCRKNKGDFLKWDSRIQKVEKILSFFQP